MGFFWESNKNRVVWGVVGMEKRERERERERERKEERGVLNVYKGGCGS